MSDQQTMLRSSAVMAAGTVVSRLSGFVRSALLAAALGNVLHADIFNIANTIPNMLYILLAGGVINAVLVPQLVRSLKNDPDEGAAYTGRVLTLVAVFLASVTVLLIVIAPWVMRIFADTSWPPGAFDATVAFARLCLPQVFFYGMFVLVGQILNARGRFGPMMWAPITNNVVSVAVLVLYLVVYGSDDPLSPTYGAGREWLLGLGSTVGIAAQLVVLVPYLRAAGVSLRPRWDFRDSGLSHTLRLGVWTVAFVIVNQIAYAVVVRLSGTGTGSGSSHATGYTVYTAVFLIIMVPHAIVTVSLATAVLPRLSARAADDDHRGLVRTLAPTLRTALAVIVPFAAVLPLVANKVVVVLWGYGAAKETVGNYTDTLMLFGPGLVFFTVHYLVLRGFYAREENRIVFYIQCAVAATNIVVAVTLVTRTTPDQTAPMLVIAYISSYAVGACLSYAVLSHRLGGLHTPVFARYLVRLLIAVAGAFLTGWVVLEAVPGMAEPSGLLLSLVKGATIGVVFGLVYLAIARALRLEEVTGVIETLTARLRR
ncbi:murein biosynthesis integral membrane protein MurJ [Nocardioides sp. Kera G14]|uniref:murein biosynthesis integral membrane protein MurJ n=1 Tax=Nocardioides sp. Kera G14 TaxID=2884264 RepID=UPI001D10841B|nr:murein biosynthesis integral membrane protein MurJ [Nocardioides sp. Kera G14]UDY23572.1 murein biosynthesis integral membrane protein MurJ [Nocardioides sp. Kera G14]